MSRKLIHIGIALMVLVAMSGLTMGVGAAEVSSSGNAAATYLSANDAVDGSGAAAITATGLVAGTVAGAVACGPVCAGAGHTGGAAVGA